jgi:hypothetical protein
MKWAWKRRLLISGGLVLPPVKYSTGKDNEQTSTVRDCVGNIKIKYLSSPLAISALLSAVS